MAKKKQIRDVLCFLVMIVILMSVMSVSAFAVNDGDNSSGDCAPVPDADLPEIYLNDTQECILSNDSGNDTNIIILTDVSDDTRETVSALGCDVYVKIDDPCCKGYKVYVDGVYQFTEGQGKTPDGYCAFHVCAGKHTIKITKNGRSASKTKNFQCGYTYRWTSMPHCWCEDGGGSDDCKYPPTVKFDKTKYYEGDTVHATVSTSLGSVYYKIKDCGGTVRKSGTTSNGKKISYTIPKGASKCCYWQICFYWNECDDLASGMSYDCTKCYNFYVCPVQTCEVYVTIEDPCCVGYKVYVDGVYQFTEGGDGTPPDGYCAFHVKEGTHTLKITKNGRSASKTIYFQCNAIYHWVRMPKNWCGDGEAYVEIKDKYCKGYEVYVDDVYQFTEGRSGTPDGNCGFFVGEGTKTIEIRKNGRSASLTKYFDCSYRYVWDSMPDYWCDPCYDPPIVTFDNPPDYQGDKPKYSGGDKLSATVSTSQSSVYYEIKDCGGTVLTNGYTSNAEKISYTIPTSVSTCCYWTICFYWSGNGGGWLAGGQDPAQYYDCIECYTFYVCPDPCYDPPIVTFINPPDYEGDKPKYSEGDTVHATVSSSHGSVYYAIKDCNGKVQTTGSAGDGDSISYLIPSGELTDCCYWTICFYWGGNGGWLATGVDPAQYYDCIICYTFEVCPICTANVKIDDDTCVGYNVYVDDVYLLTEGVGEPPDGYCSFDVIEGVHNIEIRDNECFAAIRRYFECGSTYLWVSMSDNWCKCKNCPSEVRFEGTAKTDELAGLVCYKTYYCEVIADRILYDPDNTLQVGNVYTVGYGDDPKNITAGDKIVVNGTYYHNCGPFGAYGRICGDLWKDLPDLIIEDIKWPSGTVCLGDLIPITVTVKNIGGEKANQSVVKYYVGNNYIDRDIVPSLVPNATSNQSFNWTANSCGNISVMAIADANHTVHECNESNNDKQKRIEASGPDLITHIWPMGATGTVCLGEPITFTVTVINTGDCTAGQSVVKYYAGGEYVDSELIPSLSPGASSTQTFTWTASSCGNVSVRAVADANHNVRECNENNNDKAKSVKVDGPDLIIPDITLPSGKICLGQPVTITVTVKNQGGCTAGASTVKYFVDNKYVDSDTVPSLDPGAASTQTFTWTADSCGNVSVKAVADANKDVHECDENNNDNQKSIEVDGPDLIIQDITLPSGKICLGQPVTITVTVKNEGGCTAGASTVKYFVDNKYVDSDTVPSLDLGAASTQTFTWTADSCGNVSVRALADANNEVHECDENNNEKQKSIEVDGPDLIIQDIALPSGKICLGQPVTITITVKNQGGCTAGASTVKYFVDNKYVDSDSIPSLSPGASSTQTFTWTADSCGNVSVKAVADANNEVHECDENNNENQKSIEVDGPDLIIQDITWPSGKICLDKEIEIEVTTANVGKCDAEKPFKVTLYIENNEIENATISFLDAGNQENTTFSWIPDTCGILSIKAVADVDNTIHECDENNNENQKSIEVDGPDLIIEDITWPSGKICLDKEIEIEVTTANVGKCDAEKPFKVTLYIENNEIENATIDSLGAGNQEKTTFSWIPDTCGILNIKAVADVDNTIHECDENNNENQKSIEVDGPDLIIEDITWPSGKICLDKEIEIEVTTANVGKCDAEKPFKVTLYIENKAIENATIDSLGAGNQEKTTFSWIPDTCGILNIKAVADVDNTIHECDEDNNENQKSVEVDGPDLIIQDITWPSGTICLNSPVNIEVTTANIGECPATKQFTVVLYIDSKELTATIKNLEDGNSIKSTFDWIPDACGNHNLKAVADINKDIHECNEGNNENKKSIKVEGPDLIVKEISPVSDLFIGVTTEINIVVDNQGECRAIPFSINYSIDGAEESTIAVTSSLSPHTTETVHFSWTPNSCDRHQITAVADSFKFVPECDEDNNKKTQSVDVKGPDLIVEPITVSQPTTIGTQIKFTVVIRNKGTADAGSSYMRCYVDELPIGDKISVPGINIGQTSTHDVSWTASGCGPHTFKAVADVDLNVIECDEGNNDKQTSFTVKCPDLIIESITPSPGSPAPNQQVTFSVVVKNKGDADADDSTLKCIVGSTAICTESAGSIPTGKTSTRSCTWTGSGCAEYNFKAGADAVGNKVTESDETNNEKSRAFSVVDNVKPTITIGSPSNGDTSSSSTIKAKGTASDNSGVSKVEVKVNDGAWQQASGTTSWSKTVTLTEGTNTITVKATDVCGNEQSTSITVHYNPSTPSNPDFTISIAPSSRTICAGESATYTVSLTAEDGFSSSVALEVSGLPSGATASFDPEQVTPSETATLTIDTETATTDDTYTITVTGTGDGKTHQATATLIISSEPKPDLTIHDISWKIKDGTENTVEVTVETKNQGDYSAEEFTIKYYVDNNEVGSDFIFSLLPESQTTKTFIWDANGKNPGDHEIKVIADVNNNIEEIRKDNNMKTTPITCIDIEVVEMDIAQVIKSSKLNNNLVCDKPFEVWLQVQTTPAPSKLEQQDIKFSQFHFGVEAKIDDKKVNENEGSALWGSPGRSEKDIVKIYMPLIQNPGEYTTEARIHGPIVEWRVSGSRPEYPDPNLANNKKEKKYAIRDLKSEKFEIYYVAIDFSSDDFSDFLKTASNSHIFLKLTYPIPNSKLISAYKKSIMSSLGGKEDSIILKSSLELNRRVVGADLVVGVVPVGWFTKKHSMAAGLYMGKNFVFVMDGTYTAAAHEIGHYFCLCEEYEEDSCVISKTACANINPNAPGKNGEDLKKVIPYGRLSDVYEGERCFMGRLSNIGVIGTRICPYCYKHLFNELIGEPISTSKMSSQSFTKQEKIQTYQSLIEVLFVSGTVDKKGNIEFYELRRMKDQIPDQITPGNYSIEYLDADGKVLSETPFDVSFFTEYGEVDVTSFVFAIPYMSGTKKVVVNYNEEVKDEFVLSSNPPTVSVISPNGGESFSGSFTVTWTASDLDGDELCYTLLYSNNEGADWEILAMDINETSYAVNTDMLGGGTKCMVKVIASDGANTAEDSSAGWFTVETKNPIASISSPENNSEFMEGDRIEFSGFGYDLDDGMLPDDSLVWTSSIDGVIGHGSSFTNSSLSAGVHLITLTARDSEDDTTIDITVITVLSGRTFDTLQSANLYPSIKGTHNGTIRLNQTIEVQKLYTYPCLGTAGHTEYARIWNATLNASAIWTGYEGDWHNITFDNIFTLVAGEHYNYSIRTGSYPQIHHTDNLTTANGYITCTEFIDANGKRNDTLWIPAIKLFT